MSLDTEPSSEKVERYKKITQCVRMASLIIGAGVGIGALVSSVVLSPLPVYLGISTSYAISMNYCYNHFQGHDGSLPEIFSSTNGLKAKIFSSDPCDNIYNSKDTKINEGCLYLPDITEFGKQCIEIKNKDKSDKKQDLCVGEITSGKRFKMPNDFKSCFNRPCLKTDGESKSAQKEENGNKGKEELQHKVNVYPLKRFTNPSLPKDLMTREDALKETYRTNPLKRFKNPKRLVDSK